MSTFNECLSDIPKVEPKVESKQYYLAPPIKELLLR